VLAATSLIVSMFNPPAVADDWPQFRGSGRDAKSLETGLLREWPPGGPPLLWAVDDLGYGYSSVVAVGQTLYTTGIEGDGTGYAYAYQADGTPLWKRPYGPDWTGSLPGSRTTPTYDDGRLFLISSHGLIVCLDAKNGDQVWAIDGKKEFNAVGLGFGISESPLIDGDRVICTPGGPAAGVAALNKKTGKTVWVCREVKEKSAYCSPVLIERGGKRIIVTLTSKSLIGIDANTGKLLWRQPHDAAHDIHAVSPVYEEGRFYITSGYGGERGLMVELSADGLQVTPKWADTKLDCQHGGVIVHDGHVYGSSDQNSGGNWICLNLKTGKVAAEIKGVGKGSIAFADGMLYGYGENGQVGLVTASPRDFKLVSSFTITRGDKEHWAHPTVSDGRLYIRHGVSMMAYDISAGSQR
jgi:hypothetical protein